MPDFTEASGQDVQQEPRDKLISRQYHSFFTIMVSNIQEVKARKGNVIAIVTKGDKGLKEMVPDVIEIPRSHPAVAPLLSILPLQLLAYHIAVARGCDVDQPRNLAKSVTVE
jgi:glucosamine--fructose-6-phosphate aminotransferase (isomerizing)